MNGPAQIVMIADDLSGAADCAATCAVQGLTTVVQICESPTPPVQVLSIDAASRGLAAEDAAAVTARIASIHADAPVLFKKLDSLLRGHVGIELAAMRCRTNPAVIVMAPALPAQGRTTIGGCQWWKGQKVADGPSMLATAGLNCSVVDLAGVRCGPAQLAVTISTLARTHDILVCDSETDADLRMIARATAALPRAIWAGSSGLARHIPTALGIAGTSSPVEVPHFSGPILVVVGSRTAMAREQVHEAARIDGLASIRIAPEHAFEIERDAMIAIDAGDETTEDPALCAALATWLRPHLKHFGAVIATGGETARAILMAAGVTGLRLLKEIEPGVPLAVSLGARQMPVITKSGSFGSRDTLAHCVRTLRSLKLE